jgi:hypothetical protein
MLASARAVTVQAKYAKYLQYLEKEKEKAFSEHAQQRFSKRCFSKKPLSLTFGRSGR